MAQPPMEKAFMAAKRASRRRTKWWRHHIALAYAAIIAAYLLAYLGIAVVGHQAPRILTALGASPSAVNLITGALSCAVGAWGIRQRISTVWTILFALCFLGGVLSLAKALAFL